jgi:hypothetical protein
MLRSQVHIYQAFFPSPPLPSREAIADAEAWRSPPCSPLLPPPSPIQIVSPDSTDPLWVETPEPIWVDPTEPLRVEPTEPLWVGGEP